MKECKCCHEWFEREDFSYSYDLKDRDFIGHCNECVVELGGLDSNEGLKWSSAVRYYNLYLKGTPEHQEYQKMKRKRWLGLRPGYDSARAMERHILKMERTLCAEYLEGVRSIYKEAKELRNKGEDVHVDHIVPLKGELVSGLHVPWNLQIIPAAENLSKGNKFVPHAEVFTAA